MGELFSRFVKVITLTDESLTTLMEIPVKPFDGRLFAAIKVATTALDQFEIQARPNGMQSYITIFNTSSHFITPEGILIGVSGDLTILTAGSTGWFIIDVRAIESIRIQVARASGSNAIITLESGAQ